MGAKARAKREALGDKYEGGTRGGVPVKTQGRVRHRKVRLARLNEELRKFGLSTESTLTRAEAALKSARKAKAPAAVPAGKEKRKKFKELREQLPPERQQANREATQAMLAEMDSDELEVARDFDAAKALQEGTPDARLRQRRG